MKRAIGIVRVSQVGDRDAENLATVEDQKDRIRDACDRNGWALEPFGVDELDVSGSRKLDDRPALGPAVRAIEDGDADVLVVSYLDRLCRNLEAQREVVDRVEAAGGQVFTVDMGRISHATATQRLSSTMLGAINEYYLGLVKEKSRDGQRVAIMEKGIVPWAQVTPGYRKLLDKTWEPDPEKVPAVIKAFEMRRDGATVEAVRAHLRDNRIVISYHQTIKLLGSRTVLGEIHFGDVVNEHAFEPIIEKELFNAVQLVVQERGPKTKSDRILARLGVLRCAICGTRLTVGTQTQNGRKYPFYKCPDHPDGRCEKPRPSISAEAVERFVVEATKKALMNVEGCASVQASARAAQEALARAEDELATALRTFTAAGVLGESDAITRLTELREARDAAQERSNRINLDAPALTINGYDDWDRLSRDTQRALIQATVEVVTVGRGRGLDRCTLKLF